MMEQQRPHALSCPSPGPGCPRQGSTTAGSGPRSPAPWGQTHPRVTALTRGTDGSGPLSTLWPAAGSRALPVPGPASAPLHSIATNASLFHALV